MTSGDGRLAQPERTANAAARTRDEIEDLIFMNKGKIEM
jgi:hypothetical protein